MRGFINPRRIMIRLAPTIMIVGDALLMPERLNQNAIAYRARTGFGSTTRYHDPAL